MTDLYVSGNCGTWAVYRKGVGRVSGFHATEELALDRMDRIVARERMTTRACMCCRSKFRSEGIHHRLCDKCKSGNFDAMMLSVQEAF